MAVLGFLATGTDEQLFAFHMNVCMTLNDIDRRKQTVRYSCMADDLDLAKAAAKAANVTLQQIVSTGTKNAKTHRLKGGARVTVADNIEEYPVLHQGTHGMKWEARKKR